MKTNLLIEQGHTATKILSSHVPAASIFSDNEARLFLINTCLSDYRGSCNFTRLWVWGVKSGNNTYAGLICRSGIIPDGETEIKNGVFVSFYEDDILIDETDKLNRREICPGIVIRLDGGKLYLKEEAIVPDNFSAELELKKRNPKLKGGAILLRFGEPKKQLTYWAILGDEGYEGISPFSGETATLSRKIPVQAVMIGEAAGKGFYLTLQKNSKKFVLTTKKAAFR